MFLEEIKLMFNTKPFFSDAIFALHPKGFAGFIFEDVTAGAGAVTEEQYNAGYKEITGVDENESAIFSTTVSDFTVKYADAKAKYDSLISAWNNEEYARKRVTEYPDWGTQLDYIYHNGIDKWKTDIVDPVKAKYPKPS
tara:strand:+ start:4001 stop:4417 length:417 start_codon:yes stop_codon:yes gene_type:complete